MNSSDQKKLYSLRADASALGGLLESPAKALPTLAAVSLPPVGGFAMARSGAFTADEIISCSSAYTRVSGQECCEDGSAAILVTAVVEDLNILEVVRADRIVTQLAINLSDQSEAIGFCVSGTVFEGLRIAGHACHATLNQELQRPHDGKTAVGLTWEQARQAGRVQGESLLNDFKDGSEDAHRWVVSRHRRMTSGPTAPGGGYALASVVDRLQVAGGCRSHGHIIDIPGFGQILLGELLVSCDAVQLIGIRAQLGCCPVRGRFTVDAVGGGGTGDN
jgi:hypothetical protein